MEGVVGAAVVEGDAILLAAARLVGVDLGRRHARHRAHLCHVSRSRGIRGMGEAERTCHLTQPFTEYLYVPCP